MKRTRCTRASDHAFETEDSAVSVLGDEALRAIAQNRAQTVCADVTVDWTLRENDCAKLRVLVDWILGRHGCPPDEQDKATDTVHEQASLTSAEWTMA